MTPVASSSQTTLKIGPPSLARFDNFTPDGNEYAVGFLKQFAARQNEQVNCYLQGSFGSGKSHLLHAVCKMHENSIYIGLNDLQKQPEILEYAQNFELVCLDDVHSIAAQSDWESALMALFENIKSNRNRLLVSADVPAQELGLKLRDIANRFSAAQVLKVCPIPHNCKAAALIAQAASRGLTIEDSVIRFIVTRYPQDMHSLMRLLRRLERLSLEKHRNITIPFLKQFDFKDADAFIG